VSSIAAGNLAAIATLWAGGLTLGCYWPRIGAAIRQAWEKINA
jgi:hypothetical protein